MNRQLKQLFQNFPSENDLMKVIMLTSSTAWGNEILRKDIESWLANFKGEVFEIKYERRIALWLLSQFTFYTQEEVTHLCRVVYSDLIHKIVSESIGSGRAPADLIGEFFDKANMVMSEEISG